MKKALLILFLSVTSLTACKKDEDSNSKLEGTWDLTKSYYIDKIDGVVVKDVTKQIEAGIEHMVFEGDKVTLFEDGEIEAVGTFSSTDNSVTIKFEGEVGETHPLKWNSSNEIVITSEETFTVNGKTHNDKEDRTYKKR